MARKLAEFGIDVGEPRLDWSRAVGRKDALIERYLGAKADALRERGVEWLRSPVRFLDAHTAVSDGRRIRAGKVIVASGSQPLRPPIPGVEHTLDSEQMLHLKQVPKRLVVVVGGVIAMEFASIFAHAGARVAVLEALPAILKGTEDDLRCGIEEAAPGWGVTIHTSVKVRGIEADGGAFSVVAELAGRRERFEADVVLLATGRGPRVNGPIWSRSGS